MDRSRVRLRIRSLMLAVATAAGFLALLRLCPMIPYLLLIVFLLNIPAAVICLSAALVRVRGRRLPWRAATVAAMQGSLILGAGWLWAISAISFFQGRAGIGAIEVASRTAHDVFWGLTVPMTVTGICLAIFVSRVVVLCALERRHDLLLVMAPYAWAMVFTWLLSFKLLRVALFP